MFEHYLTYQKADPKRQRRIMIASIVSGTLTFSGIIFVWAANKMTISKVEAPTVQFLMVQMGAEEAAPPPPPPPLPSVDPTAGVVWDDEFVVSQLEIRARAIQLRASAMRGSAQERLKNKLVQALPCIVPFQPAKVRDEGQRKVFDPTIEHDCYNQVGEAES